MALSSVERLTLSRDFQQSRSNHGIAQLLKVCGTWIETEEASLLLGWHASDVQEALLCGEVGNIRPYFIHAHRTPVSLPGRPLLRKHDCLHARSLRDLVITIINA
jgi:hypothetical protein